MKRNFKSLKSEIWCIGNDRNFLFIYNPDKTMMLDSTRIRHTVVFKLKHPDGSKEAEAFMNAAIKLATIAGVEKFEYLKQFSKKNNFDYGISMEFADSGLYESYNNHPDHVAFINDYWLKAVEDFLEIDYRLEG